MIYHFNAIFSNISIGQYYNRCCELVPDPPAPDPPAPQRGVEEPAHWICLWDADVMTFHTFGNMNDLMGQAIKENPDVRLFSCVANRIGTHKQRVNVTQDPNPSMKHHRIIAEQRYKEFGSKVRTDTRTVSGLMMLFRKDTWDAVGGFAENGIIGVDTDFSQKVSSKGWKVGIMEGLYVMHYYRLLEGNCEHLKRVGQ